VGGPGQRVPAHPQFGLVLGRLAGQPDLARRVVRKWIYYTITPQVQFPKEDEYEPRPSLHIGLEILFGGRMGDLL
jgi:hypothetical protein